MNWNRKMIEQLRREDLFRTLQEAQSLRSYAYGDPSRHVEFEAEVRRQKVCQQARQQKRQQQKKQQQKQQQIQQLTQQKMQQQKRKDEK